MNKAQIEILADECMLLCNDVGIHAVYEHVQRTCSFLSDIEAVLVTFNERFTTMKNSQSTAQMQAQARAQENAQRMRDEQPKKPQSAAQLVAAQGRPQKSLNKENKTKDYSLIVTGKIWDEPELKTSANGNSYVKFSLLTNGGFVRVMHFTEAETVYEKDDEIETSGKMSLSGYTSRDGEVKGSMTLFVNHVTVLNQDLSFGTYDEFEHPF
jgi:hypothetical protein